MKYFRDASNNISAYADDGSQDSFIPVGAVQLTTTEVTTLLTPTLRFVYNAATWGVDIITQKISHISSLTNSYQNAISADIAYMSTTFAMDSASRQLLAEMLSVGSVPPGFYYQDILNTQIPMIYAQLQFLGYLAFVRRQDAFTHLQLLKAQVNAAITFTDLQAVVW
jgi:hypothetical protein